jgi:hypothetical protein
MGEPAARALVMHFLALGMVVKETAGAKVLKALEDPAGPRHLRLVLKVPHRLRLTLHSPITGRTRYLTI